MQGENQEDDGIVTQAPLEQLKMKDYKPTKQEVISKHDINIQFLSRGCVIHIGCKSIPFSSTEEAIIELQAYFDNPYEVQEKWEKQLN